ncbi:MAG: protein phosphatase 2C domain-containing protein [Bacteroidales bacterium]|nr:protein phosphatase 2C domain-containing protein [Bacteroidales bacterium]
MKIHIKKPFGYLQQGTRSNQQDALYPEICTEETAWCLVCDGVGGLSKGEIASGLVCVAFARMLDGQFCQGESMDKARFEEILRYAYDMLYDNRRMGRDMATTLAFLAIVSEGVFVAHIGDSRVYQIRPGMGIIFVTEDHSLVRELVKDGKISEEEALTHERRNVITRCLRVVNKGEKYDEATIDIIRNVEEGDIFLVCTDGVHGEMREAELTALLSENMSLEEKATMLSDMTRFSNDNNTAFVIEVEKAEDGGKGGNVTYETSLNAGHGADISIRNKIETLFRKLF